MTGQLPLGGYPDPETGKLSLDIGGQSIFPVTGDPRFDKLPEDQKKRVFFGMMSDIIPPGDLVDLETGAPKPVRGTVGSLQSDEDRMRAMQHAYPQGDVQRYGDENFTFLDPATGQRTVFNPPGLDPGDFPGAAPELAGAVGSTIGAAVGGLTSPVTGPAGPIVGAGIGGQMAREATRYGIQKLTGEPDTRETRDRLLNMGAEAGMDMIGQGVGMGIPAAVRYGMGPRAGRDAGQIIQDLTDIGAPLDAAVVTGSQATRAAEGTAAPLIGGGRIESGLQDIQSAVQRSLREQTDTLAPGGAGTRMQTGGGLQGNRASGVGGVAGAETRMRQQQEALYNPAYDRVGRNTPVDLRNVGRLRIELARELQQGAVNAPQIRNVIQQIDRMLRPQRVGIGHNQGPPMAQPMEFETLRRNRTTIGRTTKVAPLGRAESTQAEYTDRLYAALSEDMNQAARDAGAGDLIDRADTFTREFHAPGGPGPILNRVQGAQTPERAYDIVRGARGSELLHLRRQLQPQEWDQFVATVLEDMGRAKPGSVGAAGMGGPGGDFSVGTFLTNFQKLQGESPEAYQAIFGQRQYAPLRNALERLIRVSMAFREVAPGISPSIGSPTAARLGPSVAQVGGIQAGVSQMASGHPIVGGLAVATGAFGPLLTARLMTNARFVNWLAGARQSAARQGVEGLGPWIGRLSAIAATAEPAVKQDIEALLGTMTAEARPSRSRSQVAPPAPPR